MTLLQALLQAATEVVDLLRVVPSRREVELRESYAVWREARMNCTSALEALDEQASSYQRNHCQRHLGNHEKTAQPICVTAGGPASSALLQNLVDTGMRGVQCRDQAR